MNGLTFHSPIWFWGLLVLLPLFALRLYSSTSRKRQLPGLVSPRLQKQLISGRREVQRWLVFILQCLALVATLTSLARPQLGFNEVKSEVKARNLFLAVDTSRSMLADDLLPSRLNRAKLAAFDIVQSLPEDRIGLIAFAGRPFLQAPLTVDHEAIGEAIDQLDTEIIPRGGTNIAAAIGLAVDTMDEAEVDQSALVIFSDGEALEGTDELEQVRARAREAGLSIIAVGVGTEEGAIIPELDDRGERIPGVFLKDDNGQVVRSRLDASALQEAASGGGLYVHLGGSSSLGRVVEQIQSGITSSREEGDSRLRPIERFLWPLASAVFFLLLAHLLPALWRRPPAPTGLRTLSASPAWIILLTLLTTGLVRADDALFEGHEAYQLRNYEEAIKAYEGALADQPSSKDMTRLNMAIGAAAFRQGNFEKAAESYGRALIEPQESYREHAHYNLGNTLFRQGEGALQSMAQSANPDQMQSLEGPPEEVENVIEQWEAAIEHYESALSLNSLNEKAAHNIEVVKKRIEDLKREQEKEQQQQEQNQEEQEEDVEDEERERQEESENESEGGESEQEQEQPSDPSSEDQESSEEEQDSEGESEPNDPNEEESDDPENSEQSEGEGEKPPESEDPGGSEPEQPDAPEEGELEANPNESQQQGAPPPRPQEMERNPETGYAPSEARQLLEALADETEVRPVVAPSRGEIYKNW